MDNASQADQVAQFPNRAGATPSEWEDLLTSPWPLEDVLPAVLDPALTIDKTARLSASSIGRLPSDIIGGHVMSIPGWPSAKLPAVGRRIPEWRAQPGIGYGIRTNHVHFVEVDIDNKEVSDQARALIGAFLQCDPPTRNLPGSSCFAVPIRVRKSNLRKSVIRLPDGNINLLARGGFIVLAGTRDGERYEWTGLDNGIPEITVDEFRALANFLATEITGESWVEPRTRTCERTIGGSFNPANPIVEFVIAGWLKPKGRKYNGLMDITCPFSDSHPTSGKADTNIIAGENGVPFFKCVHKDCAERSQEEFLSAMGYYDSPEYKAHSLIVTSDPIRYEFGIQRLTQSQVLQGFDIKGLPPASYYVGKADQASLVSLICNPPALGVDLRHDTFTGMVIARTLDGEVILRGPELERLVLAAVESICGATYQMSYVRDILNGIARYRGHDSAIDWGDSLWWDGVPRINDFFSVYIPVKEAPDHALAAARYWWLSAAARLLEPEHGAKADIMVTLKGTQGTRKSAAVKAMAPPGYHSAFAPVNKPDQRSYEDRYRKMRGKLVIEMPEFKGESQSESVQTSEKNFLSSQFDTWVEKHENNETRRVRRCMFMATTNRFALYDPTGVRRHCLLTLIPDRVINTDKIARDCNQLWAEAIALYRGDKDLQWRAHVELEEYQGVTQDAAFVDRHDMTGVVEAAIRALHTIGQPITEGALVQSVIITDAPRGISRAAVAARLVAEFLNAHSIPRTLSDRKAVLQIPPELMAEILANK